MNISDLLFDRSQSQKILGALETEERSLMRRIPEISQIARTIDIQ